MERALSRNGSNSDLVLGSPNTSGRRLIQGRNSSLHRQNNSSNPGTPSSRRNSKGRQSVTGLYTSSGKKGVAGALYPTVQSSVPSFHLREDSPMSHKYNTIAPGPPGYANKPKVSYAPSPGIPRCSSAKRRPEPAVPGSISNTGVGYTRYRNTSRNSSRPSNGSLTREGRSSAGGNYGSPSYNYMKRYAKVEAPPRPRTGISSRSNSQQRREMQDITNRLYPRKYY